MRIKPDPGAVLDVGSSEARLLAGGSGWIGKPECKDSSTERHSRASVLPGPAVATCEDQTSYVEELNQRANKQTRVMEEILSHHCGHPCYRARDT